MTENFFKEEKGQGAIEYILITGGLILSAIIIVAVYRRMSGSAAEKLEQSTGQATNQMNAIITSKITTMG